MTENIAYGIELLFGMVAIPWIVWVTVSLFNLKQENALMKMEMGIMREIKDWLMDQKRGS